MGLLSRIYRPTSAEEPQPNITELEKPVTEEVVPVIIFFHGGSFAHYLANSVIHDNLCRLLVGIDVLGNILLNPMFGGQERTESEKRLDGKYFVALRDWDWYWRAFLPEGEDRDHPACNPFGPNGRSLEGIKFPKSLVVVAGFDLIQDWQLAYVEGLKKAGQEVKLLYMEQATIGFYLLPNNNHFHIVMMR
ncbi:hypothetical protein Gorai_019743 [Gossypium raimondii]|uniref:Alpha/beta hydrolase fold-3 domain-containing protein n=3 Tax=Gossypium TaxID=3633 RepID=A0A7J8PPL4_GOSRA|nr:hypothetical protein [Gossypium raimondii]